MEASETVRRAPRFKRRPRGAAPRVDITERDVAIVRLIAEHRFLRSSHITSLLILHGWSEQQTRRRLRSLYDIGFLDKPEEQWAYRSASGARPTIYALGDKRARPRVLGHPNMARLGARKSLPIEKKLSPPLTSAS